MSATSRRETEIYNRLRRVTRYAKTLVSPPVGWGKREMAKSLKHSFNTPDQVRLAPRAQASDVDSRARARRLSFSLPSPPALFPRAQALKLTRVYGINLDAHGPNLFAAAGNCVVYAVAAICVVHELESGGQRFFHGHRALRRAHTTCRTSISEQSSRQPASRPSIVCKPQL